MKTIPGPTRSFAESFYRLHAKLRVGPGMVFKHMPWLLRHLDDGGMLKFVNIIEGDEDNGPPMEYADIAKQLEASTVTWEDLKWIREMVGAKIPIIVKGIHNIKDAETAEKYGANAVIISNHGGRQDDRVLPSLHMTENILSDYKPDSDMVFLMDGGIRRGKDIPKLK